MKIDTIVKQIERLTCDDDKFKTVAEHNACLYGFNICKNAVLNILKTVKKDKTFTGDLVDLVDKNEVKGRLINKKMQSMGSNWLLDADFLDLLDEIDKIEPFDAVDFGDKD